MGRGLHMIIYYHCNSDNALLLSFLLTCHPYIHPLSFHEMIFILVCIVTVDDNVDTNIIIILSSQWIYSLLI